MGKKVKKKGARIPHKEKRVATVSPKAVPKQSSQSVPTVVDGVSVLKERNPCAHLDKGFSLVKLSETIGSPEPVRCLDCREGAADRRGGKGKGKHEKKKGTDAIKPISDSKAIWVCLECGHYACGGVGFPTTAQSHSVRHFKQTRHPLAMQFDNPHLCWCFPCNSLIPVQKSEESGEKKDTLFDILKLIKGRPVEGASGDVEDVWFGGGSIKSAIISEGTISNGIDVRGGYIVRGLVNLGNTCFFNSIMQNLLAMDRLRDYLLNLDGSVGPLIVSLQKLFREARPEAGLRNVINPKSFFGCVCSKSPQFRGYQQHDSHELLRCLLDGLCMEELGVRKQISSKENGDSPGQVSTVVDAIFGGQISSTVCCIECGHSSTVYEPFLDLSLPVPTKKPPSKKAQPVSQAKKTKVPPKRAGRMRTKAKKGADIVPDQSVSKSSDAGDSFQQVQSSVPDAENIEASSGDFSWLDFISPITAADDNGSVLNSLPATHELQNEEVLENDLDETSVQLYDSAWLDFVEPGTFADDYEATSQNDDTSGIRDSRKEDVVHDGVLMQNSSSSSVQVFLPSMEPNLTLNSSSTNPWEDEVPLQVQGCEVLLLPYKEESSNTGEKIEEGDASSVAGHGQDSLDFDGFGDLFNEPEISAGTCTKPLSGDSQENKVAETSFMAGNSSESADEVDNTDSPVSIESCLAYFTKPELLSNEHAWHCENCSKTLREKLKMKKNKGQTTTKFEMNGGGTSSQTYPLGSEEDLNCPGQDRNFNNGNIKSDSDFNISNESLLLQNGNGGSKQNCRELENKQASELNSVVFQRKEVQAEMNANPPEVLASGCNPTCSQASSNYQSCDSCSLNEANSNIYSSDEIQQTDSKLSAKECESEESQDEELDSGSMKVKRDATKRFLIDKAPSILTIHLKRFSQDARGRLSKLNGHVGFRDTIDLTPFVDPRHKERERYDYRLLGVVEHSGTMRGGHYVAYVRGGEKSRGTAEREDESSVWYHASDAYVRQVSLEDVLRCEAYILFYEKN